jgi:hypothetical protein
MNRLSVVSPIDLFDGPSWDTEDFWADARKPTSKLGVGVQLTVGLLVLLMVPAAFTGGFAVITGFLMHLKIMSPPW